MSNHYDPTDPHSNAALYACAEPRSPLDVESLRAETVEQFLNGDHPVWLVLNEIDS